MAPETVAGGAAEGSGGGKRRRLDTHREQLLADLPDHVTLREIVSKLPWKCLGKLALVNRAWLHAMRSREIYNARVIYRALESFVVFRAGYFGKPYDTLYLYSTIDGFYLQLPALPVCEQGIPFDCECVTLDGAIYALGGRHLNFCLVYVLDLAGPRQWKQCASMLQQKERFTCAALDGKIYVVESVFETIRVSEVYDPKADTWCLIKPMPISPRRGSIIAVGEELFLLSQQMMDVANAAAAPEFKYMADVYNPAKDEWRVETFYSDEGDQPSALLFEAQGKLHRLWRNSFSVLDMDTKRWTLRHSYELSGLGACGVYGPFGQGRFMPIRVTARFMPTRVTAVGDEVLATVGSCLIQSEGFGGKDISLKWHKPDVPNSHTIWDRFDVRRQMYPIEL